MIKSTFAKLIKFTKTAKLAKLALTNSRVRCQCLTNCILLFHFSFFFLLKLIHKSGNCLEMDPNSYFYFVCFSKGIYLPFYNPSFKEDLFAVFWATKKLTSLSWRGGFLYLNSKSRIANSWLESSFESQTVEVLTELIRKLKKTETQYFLGGTKPVCFRELNFGQLFR